MPDNLHQSLGGALGTDLSGVTIHTSPESNEAAQAIGAKAYTEREQIHFASGNYDPTSDAGRRLIAHEVARTVQQRGATPSAQAKLEISTPGGAHEREADAFADAYVAGRATPPITQRSSAVSRQEDLSAHVELGVGAGL